MCVCIGMKRRDSLLQHWTTTLNLTCSEPAFEDCCLDLWNRVREGAPYISHTLSPCTLQLFSYCTCRSHSLSSQLTFPASGFRTLPPQLSSSLPSQPSPSLLSSQPSPSLLPSQPSPSLLPPYPPTLLTLHITLLAVKAPSPLQNNPQWVTMQQCVRRMRMK